MNLTPIYCEEKETGMSHPFPVIVFAAVLLVACTGSGDRDLIVLRDGGERRGAIESCDASACRIDGAAVQRSAIEWIGFRITAQRPPAAQNTVVDEVHLADGVQPGRLLRVERARVVTERAEYPRSQVSWIHLAATDRGSPGDRASGGHGCDRREVFLYDVLVTGEKSGSETVQGMGGEFAFSYAYTARYPRVPVTVECDAGGRIIIRGPTHIDPHPGSATLDRYKWRSSLAVKTEVLPTDGNIFSLKDDGRARVFKDADECGFDVAIGGLGVQIQLRGFIPAPPGGGATLNVHGLVRPDEDRHRALIRA